MKIDFHVPTAPITRRALHTPNEALRGARECGLDGIVVVETNVARDSFAFLHLYDIARVRYGLTLFQGMYLHTTLGPILLYGQRLLGTVSKMMIDRFFGCVQQKAAGVR